MDCLNRKVSVVAIFFAATAFLVLHLLSIRWHISSSVALFWVAVALMLGTIAYQCLKIGLSPSYAKVVLLEIVITCFVFHLIYQIPYHGLYGYDTYIDMASAKGIISSGFVMGDPKYVTGVSYFPMIHVFGAILSLVTGVDLFSVAKWFPSLLDAALILPLYLLVRSIFKEEKIALLSVLLFASLQHHMLFSSLFIRETYALVLAICCIYLYFSARHSPHPATKYALSIVCLIGTVFAHHLTSFMVMIFLLVHFLMNNASKLPSLRRAYFRNNIAGEKVTVTFLLFVVVALFGYWVFVVMSPLYTLVAFLRNVFTPSEWWVRTYVEIARISPFIPRIRGRIIFYGFYGFHFIFGLILLYGLLPRARNRCVEAYSSTLFLFFCGLVGFLSLYLVAPAAFPDRFLMFGWLLGFAPLVVTILKCKSKWPQKVGVFLLVAFMLFNLYMVDPTAYDAGAEEVQIATSEEDYALVNRFDFSSGKIFGPDNTVVAIYDAYGNLGTVFTWSKNVDLTKFNWVIIQKRELELYKKYYWDGRTETIVALERLATECSADYNRIYESNSLLLFKPRG